MKPVERKAVAVAGVLGGLGMILGAMLAQPVMQPATSLSSLSQPVTLESYGKLPLYFEENLGQTDESVKYLSRGPGYVLFLTPTEQVMRLRAGDKSDTLKIALQGANPQPLLSGEELQEGKSNYLGGGKNITGISHHAKVRYDQVYPGIDLVFYGNPQQLEYDFVVAPGADPSLIRLNYSGAQSAQINGKGDLELALSGGTLVQKKPVVYQLINGERIEIDASYRISGTQQVAFALNDYDQSQPLVIDPVLVYSTYLGGDGADFGEAIAVDSNGFAYIAGLTSSTNLNQGPAQLAGEGDPIAGVNEFNAFVSKVNVAGTALVYSTYISGDLDDEILAIAVDSVGNALVAGSTASANFDLPNNAGAPTCGGATALNRDAWVGKLNFDGNGLVYIRCFGGNAGDLALGLATDSAGRAYVAGATVSPNFPTTAGVIESTRPAGQAAGVADGFVARFGVNGDPQYATYLGGSGQDEARAIAVDVGNNVYVTGITASTNFQVTSGVVQGAPAPAGQNAFAVKLNDGATSRLYSTFLGGALEDEGNGIAVNANGEAYVVGSTLSVDYPRLPTVAPFVDNDEPGRDAFITKLNSGATAFVYSTYLGGDLEDIATGVALDTAGLAHVAGRTTSTNFDAPAANPLAGETNEAGEDGFVTKLNAAGTERAYSTYLGGNTPAATANDQISAIAVDRFGNAYVTGNTLSTDFNRNPTVAPFIDSDEAAEDAFIAKIGEPGQLQFASAGFSTPEAVGTSQAVLISRTGGNSTAVSVNCATTNPHTGTAGGTDFTARTGVITWDAGESVSKPCPVAITQDQEQEQTETVTLVLSAPTGGATLGTQQTTALSILDDDTPPSVLQFVNSAMTFNETVSTSSQIANIPVRRSGSSQGQVTVQCSTTNGTATAPQDFTAVAAGAQTLTWLNGDNTDKNCQVTIVNDVEQEALNETFTVTLSNPSGATTTANLGTPATSTITVRDDDQRGKLQFTAGSYTVGEGENANGITMIVRVARVDGSDGPVSAVCSFTTTGTTATNGSDFTISATPLTWANGDAASKSCTITVPEDNIVENTETVRLALTALTGGAILGTPANATLNINDNDGQSRIRLSSDRYGGSEANRTTTITVLRDLVTGSAQEPVSVCLETQQNSPFVTGSATASRAATATAPAVEGDFRSRDRDVNEETCGDSDAVRVSWGANDVAAKLIPIAIIDDAFNEGAETFTVFLTEPLGNASLGTPNSAVVTIEDNDRVGTGSQSGSAGQITITVPAPGSIGALGSINQKPVTFDEVVNDPNRIFQQGVTFEVLNVAPGGTVPVTVTPPPGADTGFVLACTPQRCVRIPANKITAATGGLTISIRDGEVDFDGDGAQNGRISAQFIFLRNLLVNGTPVIDDDEGGGSFGSILLLVLGFGALTSRRRRH